MMMKRRKVDKKEVSNPGLEMIVMFLVCKAPGPHSSISEEFLRSKKPLGSWNLVNPFLNEAWMDECAARLQPLVDQYKPKTTPNFRNRKNSEI